MLIRGSEGENATIFLVLVNGDRVNGHFLLGKPVIHLKWRASALEGAVRPKLQAAVWFLFHARA